MVGRIIPIFHGSALKEAILLIAVVLSAAWLTTAQAYTSQCFYADADTFTDSLARDTNYADAESIDVARIGDQTIDIRRSFLRFNIDAIPGGATILNAELKLVLTNMEISGGTAPTVLKAVDEAWNEGDVTSNNMPATSGEFDTVTVTDDPGSTFTWNASGLVSDWVSGARTNNGLAVMHNDRYTSPANFQSREGPVAAREPQLCVEWTLDSVSADLEVTGIEVTQGIQNLDNTVRLVEGKPTYVRVHVADNSGGAFRTFATLEVDNGSASRVLHPINENAGRITARQNPRRIVPDHAFLFQLPNWPTDFNQGDIQLTAEVNPVTSWRSRYPQESDYTNNSRAVALDFEAVPRIGIVVYTVDYAVDDGSGGETQHETPGDEADQMISWLERAYPVSDVWYTRRVLDMGNVSNDSGSFALGSGQVNTKLASRRQQNRKEELWADKVGNIDDIRYYGMVIDDGGFMRGSAANIPAKVAAGPTGGSPRFSWDSDGSWGDWYGGHELAHTFGRLHAEFCAAKAGTSYPHANGRISGAVSGDAAIMGFDPGPDTGVATAFREGDLSIYAPTWRDVMTYCNNQWVSDFTYHGLMDYFQGSVSSRGSLSASASDTRVATDRLSVIGMIDPEAGKARLEPMVVLPNTKDIEARSPGDYDIVLRNSTDTELARYAFTPEVVTSGPTPPGTSFSETRSLLITELVPYVDGTTRVDIEGPSGIIETVRAGSNAPNVQVDSPNGGETLSNDSITVDWTASDPDGDPLTYHIQFSQDGGANWELVKQGLEGNSTTLSRANLPTTSQGMIRVRATDGIHSASDESDDTFSLSTREPRIDIVAPTSGVRITRNQTLTLEADVYSPNVGDPENDKVLWVSDIQGILGNGPRLSVTGLQPGEHEITAAVNDDVALVEDVVDPVIVVDNPTLLPSTSDGLAIGPDHVLLWPEIGLTSQEVTITNQSSPDGIDWSSITFSTWINPSSASGTTPGTVTVSADASSLEPGVYTENLGLFNGANDEVREVRVTLWNFSAEDLREMIFRDRFESN